MEGWWWWCWSAACFGRLCNLLSHWLNPCVCPAGIAAERRPAGAGGGEGGGAVVMFDVKELQEVRRVGMPSHVAAVKWHPKINQIFVGIGEEFSLYG